MNKSNNTKYLRELLRVLLKNISLIEKNKEFCCGVTYTQYCSIVEIEKSKEIFLKDLAEKLNLDKSTTSRAIDSLVKLDIVKLEIFPKNRKFVKIKLTEKGHSLFEKIDEGAEAYYKKIYEQIPEDKWLQVTESIEYVLDAMGKVKCCDCSCCNNN